MEEAAAGHNVRCQVVARLTIQLHRFVVQNVVEGTEVHVLHHHHRFPAIDHHSAHDSGDTGVAKLGQRAHFLDEARPVCMHQESMWVSLGVCVFV